MCLFTCAIDHGVTEEEPGEELGGQYREPEYEGQYREPEHEDPYREQEFPEGPADGKSNSILDAYLIQFYKHNLLACL